MSSRLFFRKRLRLLSVPFRENEIERCCTILLQGALRVDFQVSLRILSQSSFRFKLEMILQPLLLSLPPRRLNYLFLLLGGGVTIRIQGPLRAPPQPHQKAPTETKEFESKIDSFLSASRHGFFNPIEPASRRTQESIHVHVQGHILFK